MKYLCMIAAVSLGLSPALAAAQSNNNNKPKPGPLAGRALEEGGAIPGAATAVLGLLVIGGVIVALSGSSDSNTRTNEVPAAE
jgi:hypothetical protein